MAAWSWFGSPELPAVTLAFLEGRCLWRSAFLDQPLGLPCGMHVASRSRKTALRLLAISRNGRLHAGGECSLWRQREGGKRACAWALPPLSDTRESSFRRACWCARLLSCSIFFPHPSLLAVRPTSQRSPWTAWILAGQDVFR